MKRSSERSLPVPWCSCRAKTKGKTPITGRKQESGYEETTGKFSVTECDSNDLCRRCSHYVVWSIKRPGGIRTENHRSEGKIETRKRHSDRDGQWLSRYSTHYLKTRT